MRRLRLALALAVPAALAPGAAPCVETGGFVKATWVHVENRYDGPAPGLADRADALALRARLEARAGEGPLSGGVSADLRAIERTSAGGALPPIELWGPADRGLVDLSATVLDDGRRTAEVALDRLWLEARAGALRVIAGRQAIGFGTGPFWTPTDLLSPFSTTEPDREVRPGTDAARVLWYPSAASELGALWAPGRAFEENAALAHARFPAGPAEVFLIGGRAQGLPVVAGSVSGELRGAELRVEGIGLRSRALAVEPGAGPRWDTAFIGGVTYRAGWGTSFILDYLVNGTGGESLEDYARVALVEPYSRGFIPFFGRRYVLGKAAQRLHPLVEGSVGVFRNLSDSSTLLWPSLTLSLSDEASCSIFLLLPGGPADSEYGVAPAVGGVYTTLHF